MDYNELKETVQKQYKNKEIIGDNGQPVTVKEWKQLNANIRKQLKLNGVKCRTAFYNPNDGKVYIKQTFRTIKVCGLEQIENTYDDILFSILDGNEKHLQGYYWDDEYIAINYNLF